MRIYRGKKFSISIPRNVSEAVIEYLNSKENISGAIMELLEEALQNRKKGSIEERLERLERFFEEVGSDKNLIIREEVLIDDTSDDDIIKQMEKRTANVKNCNLDDLEDGFPAD